MNRSRAEAPGSPGSRNPDTGRGRKHRPARDAAAPADAASGTVLPLGERLRMREEFFRTAGVDPREFLRAFDHVPGLSYFVKDAESRTMLSTREDTPGTGIQGGDQAVGRRPHEYVTGDLADHYLLDDQKVLRTGRPLRNIIEIGF